jgi:hypothetical protein
MIKTLMVLFFLNNHLAIPVADTSSKEVVFKIDFQDFFNKDTVTLRINNCLIFKDNLLMSDRSTGLTKARIKAYFNDGQSIKILCDGRSQLCMYLKGKISISILFNHCVKKYEADLTKGKYIGISKKSATELSFRQSQKPFIYD